MTLTIRLLGALLLAVALAAASLADDIQPPVKTALTVGKPTVSGKGPYVVEFEGTASLAAAERKFAGVNMTLRPTQPAGPRDEVNLSVNLPDASPKPGETKRTRFTATSLPRGTYTGKISRVYFDKDGKLQTAVLDVKTFEVP
jgi:opacity protein-like surface antigen